MNSSSNIGKIDKDSLLKSSRELILKWSKEKIIECLATIDERLFKMASDADNNDDQHRFYQSRIELKNQQHPIEQNFLKHIYQAYDNYLKKQDTAQDYSIDPLLDEDPDHQSLSLVDNSDLEESLALGAMSRKINTDCSELLYALNQRFSVLNAGRKITTQGNPIAPAVYAEAMQEALHDVDLDNPSKIWIFKLFESAFMEKLSSLYEKLNDELISKQVLPNLSRHIKKSESQNNSSEANSEETSEGSPEDQLAEELKIQFDQQSLSNQVNLFESIRHLQRQILGSNNIPQRQSTTVESTHIIAAIQDLQTNAGALLNSLSTPQEVAKSDFPQFIKKAEEEASKDQDVDTAVIEIVGLLFEYMLNDQQLPDSVKALLSYLHTPFLKIALQDKHFFEQPEHPARQLLNSLVAAGERWVEPFGKHKSDVFQQIKTVVNRLLNEFDDDVRLFSELAINFNQYLRQHSRRIRLAEKRAQQAAQGENKLKEIRLRVDGYLRKKISNQTIPPTINTLLFEPWANYLSFNLLRYGSKSEQWRQAAEAVDDIIWYCQASNSQSSHARSKSQELLKTLPKIIQTGFDTVGYGEPQSQNLLDTLFKQQLNQTTKKVNIEPNQANIDEVDISKSAEKAIRNDELLLTLKKAEFGTWFEFNAHTKAPKRVKLAWSNGTTLQFMFVNRLGQQVAILSGEKLALNIRNGKIKMLSSIENKPFFEKAMERVLDQLRQKEQDSTK